MPVDAPVREVSPSEAQRLISEEGALLIDVREPDEWQSARIPGARLVPRGEILDRLEEIPRDRPLVIQCRSGARSRDAAAALQQQGFRPVVNLRGGILAWANAGLPVEG